MDGVESVGGSFHTKTTWWTSTMGITYFVLFQQTNSCILKALSQKIAFTGPFCPTCLSEILTGRVQRLELNKDD